MALAKYNKNVEIEMSTRYVRFKGIVYKAVDREEVWKSKVEGAIQNASAIALRKEKCTLINSSIQCKHYEKGQKSNFVAVFKGKIAEKDRAASFANTLQNQAMHLLNSFGGKEVKATHKVSPDGDVFVETYCSLPNPNASMEMKFSHNGGKKPLTTAEKMEIARKASYVRVTGIRAPAHLLSSIKSAALTIVERGHPIKVVMAIGRRSLMAEYCVEVQQVEKVFSTLKQDSRLNLDPAEVILYSSSIRFARNT